MRWIWPGAIAVTLMAASPLAARAPASASANGATSTVDAFHAALHHGDTRAAVQMLAENALIFESGGVERTKAEYAAQHLPADAEFSRSVSSVVTKRAAHFNGGLAWVASEGRTTGIYKGKALDLLTTETMVLRRVGQAWKIVHIHWSSAAKR